VDPGPALHHFVLQSIRDDKIESSNSAMTNLQSDPTLFTFFNEIGIISQLSSNAFERVMPYGLTMSQFGVLNNLARLGDGKSPSHLASAFQVTRGAMTNTVSKLEASGFIDVRRDEADGRGKLVYLTKPGEKARREALKHVTPLLTELLEAFGGEEFTAALPFLAKLRSYMDAARDGL
jgi:DNA-binding MarR family transcriptional regulator